MLTITTNNHWREVLHGFMLTEKQREDFDYIDDIDSHTFIKYKGNILDPEFMRIDSTMLLHNPEFKGWHGYMSDSFFSGLLIRYSECGDAYQIARYIS